MSNRRITAPGVAVVTTPPPWDDGLMIAFSFATASSIRFGVGTAAELPGLAAGLGSRVMLVTGGHDRRPDLVTALAPVAVVRVAHEPTMDDARAAVGQAAEARADVVIGLGGGSVIDVAIVVGILLGQPSREPLDYEEVIGHGRPLAANGVPVIAVPTTAGTGSEVTANGGLASPERQVKVSLRSPAMLPRIAMVDPSLTLDCPPSVTAASGMDALTQCLEPYTSHAATPLTDGFALEGLRRAGRGLARAVEHGDDLDARTDMSLCALLGGMSLANAKLGAVHGFAGPLGGMIGAPHGAICAALLAATTRVNLAALRSRDAANPALARYATAAGALTGVPDADALPDWLDALRARLQIGGLASLGLGRERIGETVAKAAAASSMKGNPISLNADELGQIVTASL